MKKFEIERMTMFVNNVNLRKENAGEDDKVLATDVDLEANLPSEVLGMLAVDDLDWEGFLWKPSGDVNGHCLTEIGFHRVFEDYKFSIGPTAKQQITFNGAKVKKIKATPVAGTRVTLKIQVQIHPMGDDLGSLADMMQTEAMVTLIAPKRAQMDIEDITDDVGKGRKKKAKGEEGALH
jgi:hypothetical protein